MKYLEELNPEQREAVLHTDGPLLILAGAGSGKTRVLTYRIAHLINELRVYPSNILAITFTNKAAKEMKDRISRIVGQGHESIWVGTFHSVCMRILRKDIEKIGYEKSFVIFDSSDQKGIVNECLKELNLDDKRFPARSIMEEISRAKDSMITPEKYLKMYQTDFRLGTIGKVYEMYQKKLARNNALDFDDIITVAIKLLSSDDEILQYYQNKFKYIHVDEYQDTNNAQYTLISLLSGGYKNLCVVGDDDQSIYGWRGANIRNILDFEKEYNSCKVVKLEQNYRSTPIILEAANSVIANNPGRKVKKLWTQNSEGEKIVKYMADSEYKEAYFVADEALRLIHERDMAYSDFAVLYRTNAQSRVLEDVFMKQGLPYKIVGGLKFYDRKEIKDLIGYLRVLSNPSDNFSLKRIINVPKRGIGAATLEAAEAIASSRGLSLFAVISSANEIPELKRSASKLYGFALLINKLRAVKSSFALTEYVSMVLDDSGLLKELEDDTKDENQNRIENLSEFKSVAREFEVQNFGMHLEEFLEHIALVTDLDSVDDTVDSVLMMTMHSAKGLEFPVVFIVGVEEGVFPSSRSMYEETGIEEERRLCYVGITRAMQRLYFTHAYSRTLYGNTSYNAVSRFIEEIPDELVDFVDGRNMGNGSYHSKKRENVDVGFNDNDNDINFSDGTPSIKGSATSAAGYFKNSGIGSLRGSGGGFTGGGYSGGSNVGSSNGGTERFREEKTEYKFEFKTGDRVSHKKFGFGVITSIEPENNDFKVEIQFEQNGMKRLMASFANLSDAGL